MLTAYPHTAAHFDSRFLTSSAENFHRCYLLRFMERFLNWFNLVEYSEEGYRGPSFVQAILMKEVFEIKEENLRYLRQKFTA